MGVRTSVIAAIATALQPSARRPACSASEPATTRKTALRNQVTTKSASFSVIIVVASCSPIPCPLRYAMVSITASDATLTVT